jgi:hypothetical protein
MPTNIGGNRENNEEAEDTNIENKQISMNSVEELKTCNLGAWTFGGREARMYAL